MDKKLIGLWGENIAKNYLASKGYVILESNWRHHHRELDIIVFKDCVIAVEVKTRSTNANLAFTVLKPDQVSRLRLALRAYCHLRRLSYNQSRLDLIIISAKNKSTVGLRHYQDI